MEGLLGALSSTLNASLRNPIVLLPVFILEEFGVPFPLILSGIFVYAGYQLSQGDMMVLWLIPVNVAGGAIGSSSLYWMSRMGLLRIFGRFNKFLYRQSDDSSHSRIRLYIDRWGPLSVLIGRMLPIPMPVMTIAAGVFRISYLPFAFFAASSNFLWNVLYMSVGMLTGHTHQYLLSSLGKTATWMVFAALAATVIAVAVFFRLRRKPKATLKETA